MPAIQRKNKAKKQAKPQKKSKAKCPHCGDGPQTFRYMKSIYRFDINKAREIISDGRESVELEPDDVRFSVDTSRIYEEHLPHVDTKYPGIIAHIWYPTPEGEVLHGHVLVDGHHRAARCLQLGIPFFVHLLSEQESRDVLLQGPDIDTILEQIGKPAS